MKIKYLQTQNIAINLDWFAITVTLEENTIRNLESTYDVKHFEKGTEHFKRRLQCSIEGFEFFTMTYDPRNNTSYKKESAVVKFNNCILYDVELLEIVEQFVSVSQVKHFYVSELHIAMDNSPQIHSLINQIIFPKQRKGRLRPSYLPIDSDGRGRLIKCAVFTKQNTFESIKIGSNLTGCYWSLYNKSSEQRMYGKAHIVKYMQDVLQKDFAKDTVYRFEVRLKRKFLKEYYLFADNNLDILKRSECGKYWKYEAFYKELFNMKLKLKDNLYHYMIDSFSHNPRLKIKIQKNSLYANKFYLKYNILKLDETGELLYFECIQIVLDNLSAHYDRPVYFMEKIIERLIDEKKISSNFRNLYSSMLETVTNET